ncbi:MATE family efflux transporter [Streptococcus sp. 20-1249]|uniref:MATE family efflux transporter n=1 Tax=Streptococcus hepaticus TaxID=3349163 RepID=UPI00374A498A
MHPTKTLKEKYLLFFKIFIPILIYQFANYSASFIDTMMTGQFSTQDLAGVSMASSLWNPFFSLLTGIVSALVPIIGHQLGRGEKERIRQELHQFLYLACGLAALLFFVLYFGAIPTLGLFGLESHVLAVGQQYLSFICLGIFPLLLFSVFRSFFDALGLTRLSMYLMLLLVPFNSFFNYVLIFGKFGLPRLGGAGAGLGTSLSYWLLLAVIVVVMQLDKRIRSYKIWQWSPLDKKLLTDGLRLGVPIGLQIFAEVAIFAVVGLLMAKFSSQIIAAHQAAMNFATLMYAFPVSVSMALPIVISYEIGAKDHQAVRDYTRIGRLVAFGFAGFTLTFLYFFRSQVAGLYGHEMEFIKITSNFLTFALFFQLADAFAAPLQGILRGYKDTTMPFIIGVGAYWSVSLPLAFLLENTTSFGPIAYWIGLIAGIATCGLLLQLRLKKVAVQSLSTKQLT